MLPFDRKGQSTHPLTAISANRRASVDRPGGRGGVRDMFWPRPLNSMLPRWPPTEVVRREHDRVRAIQTRNSARSKCEAEGTRSRRRFGRAHSPSRRTILPKNGRGAPRASTPFAPFYCSCAEFPPATPPCFPQGSAQPFRSGDRAPQERMEGEISTMAEARFVGAPLRLRLGGRRLFAGADASRRPNMHGC